FLARQHPGRQQAKQRRDRRRDRRQGQRREQRAPGAAGPEQSMRRPFDREGTAEMRKRRRPVPAPDFYEATTERKQIDKDGKRRPGYGDRERCDLDTWRKRRRETTIAFARHRHIGSLAEDGALGEERRQRDGT